MDISLPKSWHELTQRQLKQVYKTISSGLPSLDARLALAIRWSPLRPTRRFSTFKIRRKTETGKWKTELLSLSPEDLHSLADALSWIDTLPLTPSRPDKIGGASALSPLLYELDFETFLSLDNLFQGYNSKNDPVLLDRMFRILYPNYSFLIPHPSLSKDFRRTVVIYWFAALKQALARLFPNFLQPLPNNRKQATGNPMDSVNTMLRVLTKGDITKEAEVRRMPCHRALTELDALARESEELRRRLKK